MKLCVQVRDVEVFRITQTTFAPFSSRANLELVQEVGKLLASGQFFFAWPSYGAQFDLLSCSQKQGKEQRQFFWLAIIIHRAAFFIGPYFYDRKSLAVHMHNNVKY